MKSRRVSRVLWIGSFICALLFAWQMQAPLARADDCGVPDNLFKDGKPPNRFRDPKCKECNDAMAQLQAAVDDCYALQLADAEKALNDSIKPPPKTQARLEEQKAGALKGLGQPADKGASAKQKQKENAAKDAKENKGKNPKNVLKDRIAKLLKDLDDCEKKCPPKEESATGEEPKGGTSPTGGGGVKEPPSDGEQPGAGGGEKPKGGGVQPLPTLPPLPECWKGDAKKKFSEDLDTAEQKLLKLRAYYGGHGGFTGDNEVREAEGKKVNDALKKINDLREKAANDVKDCPHGMAPQQPQKTPTENVGLPAGRGKTVAMLVSRGFVKIDNEGTGETIGHVADLVIENLTDQPVVCVIPPMVLESRSGKNQHYVCPKGQTVRIDPHGRVTVPMNGVCAVRNKPPVGKGVTGDLVINEGNSTIPQNPDSHVSTKQANDMLRICTSKYEAAEKLQKDGSLKDLPYHDKQKQLDIVVQWSTWCDPRISELTGAPPATKEDLKKVVYKQVEEKGPMTPETRKKVDQGIDTIFEKIELTTEKAKDLEPEETPAGESTSEEGVPPSQPEYVGQTHAKQPTPTPTPKGGGKTKTKPTPSPTPTPTPKKEEPKSGTTTEKPQDGQNPPTTEEKPKEPPTIPSYPFTKETDCGTITISVGEKGELVFDFKPKKDPKCPCKEFGWIQHRSAADQDDAWRYDNGVLPQISTGGKQGAKSDPSKPNQPTTTPKGTKLKDWDNNPWYGGTTDPKKPKDFDEHPTPQTHVSDKPDAPNTKYKMQLVCVSTGQVYFTWEWGPFEKGNEAVNKVGGESTSPP